jgi:hypothetical protein
MRPAELAPAPAIPLRESFSVGSALSRSLSIWSRNVAFFLGVSLVAYLPMLALSTGIPTSLGEWGIWYLGFILTGILSLVVKGLVTYSVLEQLRGRRPPATESLARGLSKAGPLFAAAFLTGIFLFGAALALVVPAIVLAVRWALLSPVVVAEGEVDPRERSAQLTAGHRWAIFGVMILFLVASTVLAAAARLVVGQPFTFVPRLQLVDFVSRLVGGILPSALTLSVSAVLYTVIYYQLRSEKEGIDIEQLTSVFR